jgi:hypothetical protein
MGFDTARCGYVHRQQHTEFQITKQSTFSPFYSPTSSISDHFTQHTTPPSNSKPQISPYSESSYHTINPLSNLDITQTPPLQIRPFKPTYHMTMALESSTISDLITMDSTFASRCKIRTSLIQTERHEVLACNPRARTCVLELYHWLTNTYLPTRFPTVYTLEGPDLINAVTGSKMQRHLTEDDADLALQLLGENVDDEFLLLLPSEDPADEGKYRLEAFVNCFPSGFNTRSKLGMLLADIHQPVPGYAKK